jgi:alanine racemase
MSSGLRCWVEISIEKLARNYHAIRRVVGPSVEMMPVVKADAYRHGAAEVSRLLTGEGARWLAVSSADEGIALRQAGIAARILVMGGILPWERPLLAEFELTPALHSLEQIQSLEGIPYHLKIDTGMGRLGVDASPEAIVEAVRKAGPGELEGLMTHFASSADFTGTQTERQTGRFLAVRAALAEAGIHPALLHMASTNPILLGRRETWANMVRPGIALYGYWTPAKGESRRLLAEVKPALAWKASIVLTKDVAARTEIGYGAMYRAERDMRIAVLGIGYADGLPHRLSNRGRVIAGGRFAPILGAVSMDLTTIDISASPRLQAGDPVTVIGAEGEASQDARHLARSAGTISYSVLCGISARVRRVYL